MKAALVERAGGSTLLVEEVLRASEVVALYQYTKPVFDVDGYKALLVQYPRNLTLQDEVIAMPFAWLLSSRVLLFNLQIIP